MAVRLLIFVQERTFADACMATRLEAEQDVTVVAALYGQPRSPHLFTGSLANVMLLDSDLPGNAALRLCEDLSRPGESPSVIMFSHSSNPARIVRAIGAGAVGWVSMDGSLRAALGGGPGPPGRGGAGIAGCVPPGRPPDTGARDGPAAAHGSSHRDPDSLSDPCHRQAEYRRFATRPLPGAEESAGEILSLPMFRT